MNQRHLRTLRSEAGTTLAELMVAVVILAVGILAVAQLFPAGTRGQVNDQMRMKANFFAQEKIERLGELTWSHVDLQPGSHGPESLGGGAWQRTYVVTVMPDPLTNLKKVEVTVSWKGGTQSVQAVTYYRR